MVAYPSYFQTGNWEYIEAIGAFNVRALLIAAPHSSSGPISAIHEYP